MTYPGGKGAAGVVQTIINQIPPHRVYVEPFAGDASVFRAKRMAEQSILIERDAGQWGRLFGEFGGRDGVTVHWGDSLELMEDHAANFDGDYRDNFFYCDPPYLPSTRVKKSVYSHEMTEQDHVRLLDVVGKLRCRVALSGYASSMYDEALSGWRRIEFQAMTRGGVRTEVLWMNYAEPTKLHDYGYVGRNRTERQSFKRLCDRWKAKLAALDPVQRRAVMSALDSVVADPPAPAGEGD